MKGDVQFGAEVGAAMQSGGLVLVALFFYNPELDILEAHFPSGGPKEEKIALMRKFKCYPETDQCAR